MRLTKSHNLSISPFAFYATTTFSGCAEWVGDKVKISLPWDYQLNIKFMKLILCVLLLPICMSSCVSYQPLPDSSFETISKELKKGDFVKLKMSYHPGSEKISEMVLSEVKGDSLLVGNVYVPVSGAKPKKIERTLKISQIAEISKGHVLKQGETSFFVGYNSFNEIYAGLQFPRNSVKKAAFEMGYQFALSKTATYSSFANPILTTVASGLRARFGFQSPVSKGRLSTFYFEYQNLQSNPFYFYESAHSFAYEAGFTEHYEKYGLRLMGEKPILKSNLTFTYSIAVFYMHVTRQYIWERPAGPQYSSQPSNRVDSRDTITPQLSIGIKVYIF